MKKWVQLQLLTLVGLLITQAGAAPVLKESFEAGFPESWAQEQVDPDASTYEDWEVSSNGFGNGESISSDGGMALVSPVLNLSGIQNPVLSFVRSLGEADDELDDAVYLKVFCQSSTGGAWTLLNTYVNGEGWIHEQLSLPNPSSQYRLAFSGYNSPSYNLIDEVFVGSGSEITPSIPVITGMESYLLAYKIVPPSGNVNGTIEFYRYPEGFSLNTIKIAFSGIFSSVTPSPLEDKDFSQGTSIPYTFEGTTGSAIYNVSIHVDNSSAEAFLYSMYVYSKDDNDDYDSYGVIHPAAGGQEIGEIHFSVPYKYKINGIGFEPDEFGIDADGVASNVSNIVDGTVVTITSEDGQTVRKYKVVMDYAPAGTDASIYGASLYESSKDDYYYHTTVEQPSASNSNLGKLNFSVPQALKTAGKFEISNVDQNDSRASYTTTGTLPDGMTIKVIAEDGVTTKSYKIVMNYIAPSSLAELTKLTLFEDNHNEYLSPKEIVQPSSANKNVGTVTFNLPYQYYLDNDLSISSTSISSGATYATKGTWPSDMWLTVTAEDGVTKAVYDIVVNIATTPSTDATVKFLCLYSNASYTKYCSAPTKAASTSSVGEFAITIDDSEDASDYDLQWTLNYESATIAANDGEDELYLAAGKTERLFTVTAEDGKTKRQYNVKITFASTASIAMPTMYYLRDAVNNYYMGVVNHTKKTIAVSVPKSVDLESGAYYVSAPLDAWCYMDWSGDKMDFTDPQDLVVTSADNNTENIYVVTVTRTTTSPVIPQVTKAKISSDIGIHFAGQALQVSTNGAWVQSLEILTVSGKKMAVFPSFTGEKKFDLGMLARGKYVALVRVQGQPMKALSFSK